MSTILNLPDQSTATMPKVSYLNKEYGLKSWLLTGDHKRIAIMYLISITFFFFIGGAMAGPDPAGAAHAPGRPDGLRHL